MVGFDDRNSIYNENDFSESEEQIIENKWPILVNMIYDKLCSYYGGTPMEFALEEHIETYDRPPKSPKWVHKISYGIAHQQLLMMAKLFYPTIFWTSIKQNSLQTISEVSAPIPSAIVDNLIKTNKITWWIHPIGEYYALDIYSTDLTQGQIQKLLSERLQMEIIDISE